MLVSSRWFGRLFESIVTSGTSLPRRQTIDSFESKVRQTDSTLHGRSLARHPKPRRICLGIGDGRVYWQ